MLKGIIDFSLKNRFIVLLGTLALVLGGVYAVKNIPLDAIPDLSDVQVIIYTEWPGQAPQIVQDQVTYPITTKILSVPKAKVVRGYSFYGFSFVYVIFADGTDLYWARSRVLEYLSGLSGRLPQGVSPSLGPDATGVGWAFMYSINSTNRDLAELRSMQDWYLRYQLASVEGVSEVASIGGFVRQYQVTVDPTKLRAYNLSISEVAMAVKRANGEVGGRSIELAEKEFILRVRGYVNKLDDLRKVTVGVGEKGVPILLGQVADVQFGPDMRRGIAELNGRGETVGGVVVVRYGANARQVILDVKKKLDIAMKGLPPDVTYSIAYDRSALIERAVKTLEEKLLEESIVVALVCVAFLLHLRSALVAIVILPIAVLISFLIMFAQGISSNIMSLGGIAIAIGAMVDAVIIMIENAHKHMEHDRARKSHWDIVRDASVEVGPTLFYSLLVITVSFFPIFMLTEQSGRMFKSLAFAKTYSMAAAALLSITLAPILMGFFIRGKIPVEEKNPINRFLIWLYHPVIDFVIKWRWVVVTLAATLVVWVFFPWNKLAARLLPDGPVKQWAFKVGKIFPFQNIGSEFMPPLYEGDLLYMPTTVPGLGVTEARAILQQTDKIIKTFPEVHHVFGKIGRAETATDPAPMDMIETTIMLKPEKEWPAVDIKDPSGKVIAHRRRTPDELSEAMNAAIQFPGLNNAWTMPIKTRIDMLATGIKTPVGIKIAGPDLAVLERVASEVEAVVKTVPGTLSAFAERTMGGNYIQFNIDREAISRYGLNVADVQDVLEVALGGMPLTTTVEGLERYAVNLRYSRDFRESLGALREIVVPTPTGAQIPLGQLAKIETVRAPMGIKSEGAVPNAWIYVDVKGIDVGTYVQMAMRAVNEAVARGEIKLPTGYNLFWSGEYEYMQKARARLMIAVPLTLLIIVLIIYLNTRSAIKTAIVMLAVPFSLVGAIGILALLHYNISVAVWVGIVALAGLDAETGVVMLLYLDLAYEDWKKRGLMASLPQLRDAIYHGAVKRVRPKAMTACVIVAGLAPILWSHGTGADVMKRIATPMIGGVITSTIMELVVYPAIYYIWRSRGIRRLPPSTTAALPDPAPGPMPAPAQ
ncbi:MAG: efflux RND transporter permease subunit [Verrucomicrobia bacterium]|jgi:Cu(I)/Ag(I) efflux system membrane protein CusA/SilA|nr:efflux RND transporter permease subunit [Verrucomicrobiota bacterium]OQC67594.1 MAG: Cation efflux system protein CusA [Verrucomicrobia bacterium ADurb.Bin006]MDI9381446.1 efflux RND transporter permease subunit [Verrucomicrobiota bacterium]NMD19645.1 efflux RND transporter permease subunit [Verrucomicrobiota bacterium]HOA61570.1 efflux RND transporter permease subunit [Verrucomicrobiota bacterium]